MAKLVDNSLALATELKTLCEIDVDSETAYGKALFKCGCGDKSNAVIENITKSLGDAITTNRERQCKILIEMLSHFGCVEFTPGDGA